MTQCLNCPATSSKVWHSVQKYDRNGPKLCHPCYQRLVVHEKYRDREKRSDADYYRQNKHRWYGKQFKDSDAYAGHLYDSFVNRDKGNRMSRESFINVCKGDRLFKKTHADWVASGFRLDLQPMVRKKIFSDPFDATNIDWTIKKEVDDDRETQEEAFDSFVRNLVYQRSHSSEETVLDRLNESKGFFWNRRFNLSKVRKAYQERIKAGLRDGTLVQNVDYIDEV